MSARPIAASPAAIVITKTEKTWPVRSESRREKAMRFRLTAFSISSIDIRTVRKLRRTRTPKNPIAKSRKLTIEEVVDRDRHHQSTFSTERLPRTTAPIIATSRKTDATSNGSR